MKFTDCKWPMKNPLPTKS